jgi:protein-disulfide isomerase
MFGGHAPKDRSAGAGPETTLTLQPRRQDFALFTARSAAVARMTANRSGVPMGKFKWLFLTLCVALPLAAGLGAATARAESKTPSLAADDRVMGKADAPVTIFEYASLTCPHCAEFERETLPQIKKDWIDTGKAKLVYRDYPLDGVAVRAAVLARCAPAERYFGFIDAMFRTQEKWVLAKYPNDGLKQIAHLGGMSDDQFNACLKDTKLTDQVVGERLAGEQDYGIEGTPTFFVNGTKIVGEKSYADWEKTLNAATPKS